MPAAKDESRLPIGYLLSHYPSANHTYLLREVRTVRAAGIQVVVVAITGDTRPLATVTAVEREEVASTYVVKAAGALGLFAAHVATAATRPVRYANGLVHAVRLAGPDVRRMAYHLAYFAQAVAAGRALRRAGCSHVHTHYATTVAVIAARIFSFELSASIHGSAEFIEPRAFRLREKVAACSFVRAISYYGRSQIMMASAPGEWSKVHVVRLGVDPDEFPPARGSGRAGVLRLVSVGQLQPAKGFHMLLESVAALVRDGRGVCLTLIGGGAERDSLESRARDLGLDQHVKFTGALNQRDVRKVLGDADAFVLASFAEGIPVVLMEAMASGLPCVATRITGIPELINHGVDGLLVTPAHQAELSAAIAALADDPLLRRRLGAAARARVVRDFDLRSNTAALVELFRRSATGAPIHRGARAGVRLNESGARRDGEASDLRPNAPAHPTLSV